MSRGPIGPPDDDDLVLELPEGLETIPLAPDRAGLPREHVTFDGFWQSLGKEPTEENLRLRELFYEWLGQHGYDVHHRDEPTVIGDLSRWTAVWERYLKVRRLK